MENISWGKTVSNWGTNNSDAENKQLISKIKVEKISNSDAINALDNIHRIYIELLTETNKLNSVFANKGLHDSFISLISAKKSLDSAYVKYEIVETEN